MKKVFLVIAFLLSYCVAPCQNLNYLDSSFYAGVFNSSVPSIAEFMDRFNCKKINPQVDQSHENYKIMNVFSLFRRNMFKSFDSSADTAFAKAANFSKLVSDNACRIAITDTNWLAVADCSVKYKGKDAKLKLWLAINSARYQFPTWTIVKAEGDMLSLDAADTRTRMFISSTYHELNFMSLHAITQNNADNILNFSNPGFEVDQTSVFFALVKNRMLTVEKVEKLEFVFCQVPGYRFYVNYRQEISDNSGWLIYKLDKVSDKQNKDFIYGIYNKR